MGLLAIGFAIPFILIILWGLWEAALANSEILLVGFFIFIAYSIMQGVF